MGQVERHRRSTKQRVIWLLLTFAAGVGGSIVAMHYVPVRYDKKACQRANAEQIMNHPQDTLAKNPC
jgi:hypothetical protein